MLAKFTKWNGDQFTYKVSLEWINDIAGAVKGQYYFVDNVKGFCIDGAQFAQVVFSKEKTIDNN